MTSKLFAVLAVLMVVSQVVSRPPATSLSPEILLPDYGDECLTDLQCSSGFHCEQADCFRCAGCTCPPARCVPKEVETEPVQDQHIG